MLVLAGAWFPNYLSDQQQSVNLGTIRSEFLPISKGVPQGSILGPVLFTIYINNILSSLTNYHAHLYAQLAVDNLQHSFDVHQSTLNDLKVVLNAHKTKFMLISRARGNGSKNMHISTVQEFIIERVTEYKYLGIWIDDKFTFKFHIDNLVNKLRQIIVFL